jgi:predicted glycosyl hydrolase (DUF1957 family)
VSLKYFSLVLHSHIPYVIAHGSWPHGMDWLDEAAAILSWLQKKSPLTEEEARLLESWEQEDGIFEELVISDGTHI